MKVLITGGAGFIGSEIVEQLSNKTDFEVVVLDNLSPQIHSNNPKDSYLYNKINGKCQFIRGDIRDLNIMCEAVNECEYIIHLAAETGTGQSMYRINQYNDVNIMGTSTLFQALSDTKSPIKKIVLASSRSVYGEGKYQCKSHGVFYPEGRSKSDMEQGDYKMHCPVCGQNMLPLPTDEESKIYPLSLYAFTKYAQEKMIETMCKALDINYTIFRLQNVYGKGQSLSNPYTGILSIFSERMLQNADINIFEDGQESRDFIHVIDVARAFIQSLENAETNSKILNLGSGKNTSVLEVAQLLRDNYGSLSVLNITGDFRIGDIAHNMADMTITEKLLNFKPQINLLKGLEDFSKWVRFEGGKGLKYEESLHEMRQAGLFISKKTEGRTS